MMVLVMEAKKRREEEEAQEAADAAKFNSAMVAWETEQALLAAQRARAKEAERKQQEEDEAWYQAKFQAAVSWGLRPTMADFYRRMVNEQGYPAAIAELDKFIATMRGNYQEQQHVQQVRQAQDERDRIKREEEERKRREAEAAAAAAAAAEAEKNKPWWQKLVDGAKKVVEKLITGTIDLVEGAISAATNTFINGMIALGNSGPLGKAIVTTMAKAWDIVATGSKAIVDIGLGMGQKILEADVLFYKNVGSALSNAFIDTMVSIGNSGPIGKAIVSSVSNAMLSGIHSLLSSAQSLFGGYLPYSLEPSSTFKDINYSEYHQYQGDNNPYCVDTSLSMTCKIFYGSQGRSNPACDVKLITKNIDSIPLGRFPNNGGATPLAINKELHDLGIPYTFLPCATLEDIDRALAQGKIVMVSEGTLSPVWGHVMLIVGMEGDSYLLLNLGDQEEGITKILKRDFERQRWVSPVHPCWIIG